MKSRLFAVIVLLVLIAFSSQVQASLSSPSSARGSGLNLLFGLGAGYHSYYTNWYYYDYYAIYKSKWPHHKFNRIVLTGFLEMRPVFNAGPIQVGARGELHFGFLGGTKEDWVSEEGGDKISGGGITAGAALLIKLGLPVDLSPPIVAVPYVGVGFQNTNLYSNGEGVGSESSGYDYDEGWGEFLLFLPISIGVDLELDRIILGLDLRFATLAGGWTTWEPGGHEPETEGFSSKTFTVALGYRL